MRTLQYRLGSQLETDVKPILMPMIRGEARGLSQDELKLVSAWFYLKAMVSEWLVPTEKRPGRYFNLAHGKALKANLTPPGRTAIWVGKYVGSRANAGWVMDRGTARQISEEPAAGMFWHSVTYSIGQVLLQLLTDTGPISLSARLEGEPFVPLPEPIHAVADGDWDSALTRIWKWQPPSVSVIWPPPRAFGDRGFVQLAERWLDRDELARSVARPPRLA